MRTTSSGLAGKFRDITARVAAAFREQREIEARRALQRYGHLLDAPLGTFRLNEVVPACSEKDILKDADGVDPRDRAIDQTNFQRA
ncbi:hypothetical protein JQ554_01220 [Bradyrhizobium diazoefficiens]|nr:hypothetical protein [Bradyrhizobium diazoefficiens]UCF51655.1 MAG: hypothetical protein JSV48_19910 [Bradyrhizobium sp.]MBR0962683.1 hypothetical protein [Bradyrhizobium diazoefficiens]MBR0976843.1 hypothetical protein [Bradyrhizobium diazoefficiens]MBR1005488.1 hypothetical protein [Bradyrhizobium diazoefficiens]MBR1011961.1 hypothetical protein [Bradyrhizobium diazoefficiens]